MKIRNGFVSNSSSSSYIVHASAIGKENFDALVKFLEEYVDNHYATSDPIYWGDSYRTFDVENNYLYIELFHAPDIVWQTFRKYVVDADNDAFHIEG